MSSNTAELPRSQLSRWTLSGGLLVLATVALLAVAFHRSLASLWEAWMNREEYSHGILLPVLAGYLLWLRADEWSRVADRGSWWGAGVLGLGLLLGVAGALAAMPTLSNYGFLVCIYGLFAAIFGWRAFRSCLGPLAILLFMIPLPNFLYNNLSLDLQLVSSQIGVWLIRAFGISVFLEGNVIDLGTYKLQVAEACDGLRYLFPLLTLAFIVAYFFRAPLCYRAVLILSSIPITILMNSLRIATIGVMVEHGGTAMAEGFVHDFQGWLVFMLSAGVLLAELIVLARLSGAKSWRNALALDLRPAAGRSWHAPKAASSRLTAVVVLLAASSAVMLANSARQELVPARASLLEFPTRLGDWSGRKRALEQVYLDVLKPDDYVVADYVDHADNRANLYIAWFASQREGQSAIHSPRTCLPGGGWRIASLDSIQLAASGSGGKLLHANRAQIELGSQKQLVYYWFQQRGRVITNEYVVKWYLFWDSLTRRRTDGALVRLITPLRAGESAQAADARLSELATSVASQLGQYVPD